MALQAGQIGLDALVMMGEPIREPVSNTVSVRDEYIYIYATCTPSRHVT